MTNITVNGSSDTIAGDLILPQENNGYKTHGMYTIIYRKVIHRIAYLFFV